MTEKDVTIEKDNGNVINKPELIDLMILKCNFTKSESTRAVTSIIDIIQESLKNNIEVQIRKFGTFIPTIQKAYTGRNPHSGETIEVAEKRSLKFKPSKILKNYINDEIDDEIDDDE